MLLSSVLPSATTAQAALFQMQETGLLRRQKRRPEELRSHPWRSPRPRMGPGPPELGAPGHCRAWGWVSFKVLSNPTTLHKMEKNSQERPLMVTAAPEACCRTGLFAGAIAPSQAASAPAGIQEWAALVGAAAPQTMRTP